ALWVRMAGASAVAPTELPKSTIVGESASEKADRTAANFESEPASTRVGESEPSGTDRSPEDPLPPAIFSPEDDGSLSPERGGFLSTIQCCGRVVEIRQTPFGARVLGERSLCPNDVGKYTTIH